MQVCLNIVEIVRFIVEICCVGGGCSVTLLKAEHAATMQVCGNEAGDWRSPLR